MSSSTLPEKRAGATQSFNQFLESYSEGVNLGYEYVPRDTADIRKVWEGGRKPFVKSYPGIELSLEGAKRWGEPQFTNRAFFTPSENFPVTPDTLHIQEGNLSDFMAEMGHAYDYNIDPISREKMSLQSGVERKYWGEGVYGKRHMGPLPSEEITRTYPAKPGGVNPVGIPFTDYYLDFTMPFETTHKKYIPGVTKQEDVPVEFHAHDVTEKSLWDKLGIDK